MIFVSTVAIVRSQENLAWTVDTPHGVDVVAAPALGLQRLQAHYHGHAAWGRCSSRPCLRPPEAASALPSISLAHPGLRSVNLDLFHSQSQQHLCFHSASAPRGKFLESGRYEVRFLARLADPEALDFTAKSGKFFFSARHQPLFFPASRQHCSPVDAS